MRRKMILVFSTLLLASAPLFANISVAHGEKSASTVNVKSYATKDGEVEVVKEDVMIGNENAVFERTTYESGVVHAKLTQKDTQTVIEYDPSAPSANIVWKITDWLGWWGGEEPLRSLQEIGAAPPSCPRLAEKQDQSCLKGH